MVSCHAGIEGRRMQYLRCGNLWRNIGKNRKNCIMVFIDYRKGVRLSASPRSQEMHEGEGSAREICNDIVYVRRSENPRV